MLIDFIIAVIFGVMFIFAVFQIVTGAWWHILTATISGTISWMMFDEARRLQGGDE